MEKISWTTYAIATGFLFGPGIILTNIATRAKVSLLTIIPVWGLIWFVLGTAATADWNNLRNIKPVLWLVIAAAGVLFFFGNATQFSATQRAPFSGYALVIVTVVSVLVTFVYEAFSLWQVGKLKISPIEIVASLLGLLSVLLFVIGGTIRK